jgi:hypothetical protein
MRREILIPPLLFTISFILSSELFEPQFHLYWILIIPGVLINLFVFKKTSVNGVTIKSMIFLLLPLLLLLFIIPLPHRIGIFLLILGISLFILGFRKISYGFFTSGLELLFISLSSPLLFLIGSRFHSVGWLSGLFTPIFSALGYTVTLSDGTIFLRTMRNLVELTPSLEKIGFYFAIPFSFSLLPLIFASRRKRIFITVFLALALFLIVRFVFLSLLYIDYENPSFFWKGEWQLSFLPLVILFYLLPGFDGEEICIRGERNPLLSLSLGFLSAVFLLLYFGFHDPGIKKEGIVLIDESHSDWAWTTREYDTEWYGPQSGYNYYCFADYIDHFYRMRRNFSPITEKILGEVDILIIKTPTVPFRKEEIDAIEKFVRKGGGLFLIGDHTNVFGSTTYLNPLASKFGLRLGYDSTYDLNTLGFSVAKPSALLPHPVMGKVPPFMFATSCTAYGSLFTEDIILGTQLRTLLLDYSRVSFFPNRDKVKDFTFGVFIQAIGKSHGRGRVLLFTDSTVFSNFYFFLYGRSEFALSSLDWLNRRNLLPFGKRTFFILSILLLFISLALVEGFPIYWSGGFASGFLILLLSLSHLDKRFFKIPTPRIDFKRVAFEKEHSGFIIPTKTALKEPSENSLYTFFLWTQRMGLVPSLETELEGALERGDIVIITDPVLKFSRNEIEKIKRYIEKGGSLLILLSKSRSIYPLNALLKEFDIRVRRETRLDPELREFGEYLPKCFPIEGGEPLLLVDEGIPILVLKKVGEGLISVFTGASAFMDNEMGDYSVIPTSHQLFIYRLEFWLLGSLLEKNFNTKDLYKILKE